MPICTRCDAVTPEGYVECQICGAPIVEKSVKRLPPKWQHVKQAENVSARCHKCYALNPAGTQQCRQCGEPLGAPVTAIRPAPASSMPWVWIGAAATAAAAAAFFLLFLGHII